MKDLRDATKGLWEATYTVEPFWPPNPSDYEEDQELQTEFSYDILSASLRQSVFYYQVSLPHFRNLNFLQNCIRRYTQYLQLKEKYPDQFLVPCYDMDIVWHTHQVNPEDYVKDTTKLLGHILPHDDSVNDRTEGLKLCNSQQVTEGLWQKEFNENFGQRGAMYRGQPPQGKLINILKALETDILSGVCHDLTLSCLGLKVDQEDQRKLQKQIEKRPIFCLQAIENYNPLIAR